MEEEPDPIPWLDELLTRMRNLDPGTPAGWALAGEIRTAIRNRWHAADALAEWLRTYHPNRDTEAGRKLWAALEEYEALV